MVELYGDIVGVVGGVVPNLNLFGGMLLSMMALLVWNRVRKMFTASVARVKSLIVITKFKDGSMQIGVQVSGSHRWVLQIIYSRRRN